MVIRLKYLLCFMICSLSVYAQEQASVTVWVHGTYPALKWLTHKRSPFRTWVYAPMGLSLAKELDKDYYFHQLAYDCYARDPIGYDVDNFYLFGWYSSNMRPSRRKKEGKKLQKALDNLLNTYHKTYKKVDLRLVGVSHGGNVILNCIDTMPAYDYVTTEVILLATPIQESTRVYVNRAPVHKVYSFYSNNDWMQRIDAQKFHHDSPKKSPFWSSRTFKPDDRVTQVHVKVNNKDIGHGKYRSIAGRLPDMMKEVKQKEQGLENPQSVKAEHKQSEQSKHVDLNIKI